MAPPAVPCGRQGCPNAVERPTERPALTLVARERIEERIQFRDECVGPSRVATDDDVVVDDDGSILIVTDEQAGELVRLTTQSATN